MSKVNPQEVPMATTAQIKKFIGTLGNDPKLIDELSLARNPKEVTALLVKRGLLGPNDPPLNRQEITKEVTALLHSGHAPTPPKEGERLVEWVAAVGQLAGAAAAGFCAA
jgi:hypothetical protein